MPERLTLEGKCPSESTDEEVRKFIDTCIVRVCDDRFDGDYIVGNITWVRPLDNFWQAVAVIEYHGEVDNG